MSLTAKGQLCKMDRMVENEERDALGILWERPSHRPIRPEVPRTVRARDCAALAEWIATSDSLRDHRLAFRVVGQLPLIEELDPRLHGPFHLAAAKAALRDLRAGQPADTATVVRLARHILETE